MATLSQSQGKDKRPAADKAYMEKPMKRLSSALVLLLLLYGITTQAATVYRWVDEKGRVHFSDQPRGNGVQTVQVRPTPPATAVAKETSAPPPEARSVAQMDKGGRPVREARRQRKARHKNCQIARDNLERNLSIARLYRVGPDGERHYLSEAEREAVLEKSRRQVKAWCG